MGPTQRLRGARHAAWLFVAAGLIGLVHDTLLSNGQIVFDLVNLTVGLVSFRLPWDRWPAAVTLALPTLAFANLSLSGMDATGPDVTFGVWFVLVYVWIGLWLPPSASLLMAPVAAAAYLAPTVDGAVASPGAVLICVPVAVVVGYAIARKQAEVAAAQAGQAEAMAALAQASVTDDLTGLGNRRAANTLLDALVPGDALAILDLDNFKQVNDSLGHQRGDEVLHDFGRFLQRAVRGDDTVARLGGEEFVVVLHRARAEGVATIERLLDAWRATKPAVTFSAGIAVHAGSGGPTATFARADRALYEAKSTGRNRVVASESPPTGAPCGAPAVDLDS